MKKEIFVFAALALCAQAGISQAADSVSADSPRFALAPADKANDGVAATVNNDKIMVADVSRQLNTIIEANPELKSNTPEAKRAVDTFRQTILDNLIKWRLQVQEARRRKIEASEENIAQTIAVLRGEGVSDAEFAKELKKEGRTLADMRQFVTEILLVDELSARLTADITASDEEIKTFYDANLADWKIPEAINAHHILIAFGTRPGVEPTAAQKTAALKRANSVLNTLKMKGSDFEVIAAKHSDSGSKTNGGNIKVSLDQWEPPLARAVQAAKIGALVGPVEVANGYSIVRVDKRTPASSRSFAEVKNYIKAGLIEQKSKEKMDQQIQALRSTAKIVKFI